VPPHHLFRILLRPALPYPPDIQRPIDSCEASDSTHIISIVGVLLTSEAVEGGIGKDVCRWGKAVEEGAVNAVGREYSEGDV
jgi:hypothetical protein